MSSKILAIKVDVDTRRGALEGVPRLGDILGRQGAKASFFFSLGPDNSGRAIWRVLTRKGFLSKMIRTKAPAAYGIKTLLYGTLLPAPIIGRGLEGTARRLEAAGHELGLHAWDHVGWHDRLWRMSPGEIEAEVSRGIKAFEDFSGTRPLGFAAPAWRISHEAVDILARAGLTYLSACRGRHPFRPAFNGQSSPIPEIPTTLPTADEILGREGVTPDNLDRFFLDMINRPGLHVLTAHAEMEGMGLAPAFERLLTGCREGGVVFTRMMDLARDLPRDLAGLETCEVIKKEIPGRAGRVSYQAS